MRTSSVFNFLKNKSDRLYGLCILFEKFIVTDNYRLAMACGKVILDLFCEYTKMEFVFTIDVFNDPSLKISKADIRSVHETLFTYIYNDYFLSVEDFLQVDYEFDFSYLKNPVITNDEIYLMLENLSVSSINGVELEDLSADERASSLETIRENLNEFLKENILSLELRDCEGNVLSRKLNFEAVIRHGRCEVREIPPQITLDEHQKSAVEYLDRPLLINAGPGAGKTRVIIERVVHLIENGADPKSVLVITFTNKAAEELRERFKKDTKLDLSVISQMRISTIHSFCRSLLSDYSDIPYNLLKRESERNLFFNKHRRELGFSGASFLRNYESGQVLKKYEEYALFEVDTKSLVDHIENRYHVSQEYLDYIDEFFKRHGDNIYPSKKEIKKKGFRCEVYKSRYHQIAKSYPKWIELMEREHVCDQNYLLIKALEILSDDGRLSRLQYKNVLIDEFQDTDAIQMQIFARLKSHADTFTVVGDADQSIYSFRGANPKFFNDYVESEEFEKKVLVNNYRSTADIVDFNERYISSKRSNPKDLKTVNESGMPVYLFENIDDEEEYRGIAFIIKNLMDFGKISKYSDVCVLFRSHKDKKRILEIFESEDIPYYLKGINDLIYQDETKAVLALFWYMLSFDPSRISYYGDGGQWINLSSFTDIYYESSKIFKLSAKTMEILHDIELKYHQRVINVKKDFAPMDENARSNSIMDVVRDYSDDVLESIFQRAGIVDISLFSRQELSDAGIDDEHDLEFFTRLNALKATYRKRNLTSLQIYYELLKITGFLEDLLSRDDFESKKALLNLSLISEIISDYENIMGKYDITGLFSYLHRSLKYYSCPINEEEDNTDKVHIMTVHKAKGLEYPCVITASIKDRSFPLEFSSQRKAHVFGRVPQYPTPNRFLKYKADEKSEAEEFNREEERVLYVANTRCEELLILSANLRKNTLSLPRVLKDYDRCLERLEPSQISGLKKLTSHMAYESGIFNQIEFEDILEDYLFCPVRYNIQDNLKFKNPVNINKFIDSKLKIIINRLHNPNLDGDWDSESIRHLVGEVIRSYSFASGSKSLNEMFENLTQYWRDYGSGFDVAETSYPVSLEVEGYDINGTVDLIVRRGESVSLIHFIRTRDEMRNYHSFYMQMLSYYAVALSEKGEFEVESIGLYVLDEAKLYESEFTRDGFVTDWLKSVVRNIRNATYSRHTVNCGVCEFSSLTCSFDRFEGE